MPEERHQPSFKAGYERAALDLLSELTSKDLTDDIQHYDDGLITFGELLRNIGLKFDDEAVEAGEF